MAKLTTHVLDMASGKPAAGVKIALFKISNLESGSASSSPRTLLKSLATNQDGRCDAALLEGDAMQVGQYELVFFAGDYFAAQGVALPSPRFIDQVTLAFGIADLTQNYHVPLVVSPWAYSTYRGS